MFVGQGRTTTVYPDRYWRWLRIVAGSSGGVIRALGKVRAPGLFLLRCPASAVKPHPVIAKPAVSPIFASSSVTVTRADRHHRSRLTSRDRQGRQMEKDIDLEDVTSFMLAVACYNRKFNARDFGMELHAQFSQMLSPIYRRPRY